MAENPTVDVLLNLWTFRPFLVTATLYKLTSIRHGQQANTNAGANPRIAASQDIWSLKHISEKPAMANSGSNTPTPLSDGVNLVENLFSIRAAMAYLELLRAIPHFDARLLIP